MNIVKPSIDALLKIWQENSPAARIGILLLAALCAVAIGGVGYWSVQPSYVVLVSESESGKVDKVVDALDKAGIDYQLSGAGGNLMVDKRDYAKARLLARSNGVADSATAAVGSLGGAFGSPTERRNMARVQKQLNLASTIKKLTVIENADVHLNIPDKGPFERKKSTPSASVLLTLTPGARLSDQQALSIASFVAYAVEDLAPKAVQITDKDGRSYTIPDDQVAQINSQVEYVAEAERKLEQKAQTQLLHFLGFGNASVQVSLDYTFKSGSITKTDYDPDGKVASEEDLVSETTSNVDAPAVGPATVAANVDGKRRAKSNVQSKTENIKTTYLVPKTEETQANSTPVRNLMTVSVLVNSSAEGLNDKDGNPLPGLNEKVAAIVKNAVGFKEDVDAISVELLPFPSNDISAEAVAAPFDWSGLKSIIESASLAIAALAAFVMGIMMLRRFRPMPEPEATASSPQMDRQRMENVNQLSSLIKDNPEVFAQIVRSWSGAEETDSSKERRAA
ncbi:flagellar basal-body MS-ring/collar protein FliF [Stieleria marina]|uniref:Flagellar M-ring protein n=1 Tax=Stieleria marina TaxID=1930275 RepID=A0A517NVM1_9BACT|nr:Flagellar M-ring protein [Planctomycetes bacterium K23_9]